MFKSFIKWYDEHFIAITWFFVGWFALDVILNAAKGKWIDVLIDVVLIAINVYLYNRERRNDFKRKIKEVKWQQGQAGNYDYDEYMRGLYNGIELADAIIEDRDPIYKSPTAQEDPRV